MNKGTKGSRKTSTWFMNTPLAFHEEKNVNKSAQKKITLIFSIRTGIRTHGHAKLYIFVDLLPTTQPRSCVLKVAIILGLNLHAGHGRNFTKLAQERART